MKRLVCLAVVIFTAPAMFAGVAYRFRSVTTGVASQTLDGTVKSEGSSVRMDLSSGDGLLFKNGAVIVSNDGGRTLLVTDPATKSYYQLDLTDLLGGASAVTRQFGELVKFDVRNSKVNVKHAGNVGPVEGLPAKRSTVDSSYDLVIKALGQNITMNMKMATEVWWTDRLPAEYTNFLQLRGVRTGIEAVDKLLESQTNTLKGFPLRQVTKTTVTINGRPTTSTTTSTVSALKRAKIDAAQFRVPAGYTRTDNPIEKMMKRFGTR